MFFGFTYNVKLPAMCNVHAALEDYHVNSLRMELLGYAGGGVWGQRE